MEDFKQYENLDVNEIYSRFLDRFWKNDVLVEHRTFIENNGLGFGEKPFHVLWNDIINLLPKDFRFLEIGVYKGQILSLVKLLSKNKGNEASVLVGVTPLDTSKDKFSSYQPSDFEAEIRKTFDRFNLEFSNEKNLIIGSSTDNSIKDKVKKLAPFDVVYIDGCHDYECVVSDIQLMKDITVTGSFVVLDDASCYKGLESRFFSGHPDVCNAIKEHLENDDRFEEIITVGHNRLFKRII